MVDGFKTAGSKWETVGENWDEEVGKSESIMAMGVYHDCLRWCRICQKFAVAMDRLTVNAMRRLDMRPLLYGSGLVNCVCMCFHNSSYI